MSAPGVPTGAALSRAARTIIERLVGKTPTRVLRLRSGVMNIKFVAKLADGRRFVVRFYPATRATVVEYEPDLIRVLRARGLPVADVISDSRSGPSAPLAYIVYSMIPGAPFRGRRASLGRVHSRCVAAEVSSFLAALADVPVRGWGDLSSSGSARFESWRAFLECSFDDGLHAAASHRSLPRELLANLERIRVRLDVIQPPPTPRLAWGDLRTDNVIVSEEGRLAGVVDFEGVVAAEPALNLGYSFAAYGAGGFTSDLARSWSSDGSNLDEARIWLYAVLRGIRIAPYAHMSLPAGARRRPVDSAFPGFPTAAQALADCIGRL